MTSSSQAAQRARGLVEGDERGGSMVRSSTPGSPPADRGSRDQGMFRGIRHDGRVLVDTLAAFHEKTLVFRVPGKDEPAQQEPVRPPSVRKRAPFRWKCGSRSRSRTYGAKSNRKSVGFMRPPPAITAPSPYLPSRNSRKMSSRGTSTHEKLRTARASILPPAPSPGRPRGEAQRTPPR